VKRRVSSFPLREEEIFLHSFHSHPILWNLVTHHLAKRKAGKCTLKLDTQEPSFKNQLCKKRKIDIKTHLAITSHLDIDLSQSF
jgi:hypothetical protein